MEKMSEGFVSRAARKPNSALSLKMGSGLRIGWECRRRYGRRSASQDRRSGRKRWTVLRDRREESDIFEGMGSVMPPATCRLRSVVPCQAFRKILGKDQVEKTRSGDGFGQEVARRSVNFRGSAGVAGCGRDLFPKGPAGEERVVGWGVLLANRPPSAGRLGTGTSA